MLLLIGNFMKLILWLCVIYYSLDIVVQCIKLALKKERPGKRFKLLLIGNAGTVAGSIILIKVYEKAVEKIPIPHTREIMIAGIAFIILKEIFKIIALLAWDIDTDE